MNKIIWYNLCKISQFQIARLFLQFGTTPKKKNIAALPLCTRQTGPEGQCLRCRPWAPVNINRINWLLLPKDDGGFCLSTVYGYLAILPASCAFFWKMGTWRLNSCSASLRETCSCKLRGSTYWTTASAHQVEGRTAILATRFAALVSSTVWSDGHDTLTAAANSHWREKWLQQLLCEAVKLRELLVEGFVRVHCGRNRPIRRSGWTSTSLQTSFEQLALSQWFLARKAECCEELDFWRIGRSWPAHSSNSPILYQCMSESLICMRIVARMAHTRLIGSQITIVAFFIIIAIIAIVIIVIITIMNHYHESSSLSSS